MPAVKQESKPSPEAARKLLAEAMKQPGVRELMEAYQDARRVDDAAAPYRAVLNPPTVEWSSDSTAEDIG